MISNIWLHPALILIIGACAVPFFRGALRVPFLLLIPTLSFGAVLSMTPGVYGVFSFADWELVFGRVDSLSLVFAYIMALMCILGTLYGLHVRDPYQHMAAWFYVAGSLGVIFAGDFLVLFLFWEIMAFASTFLIWFRGRAQSLGAGYRYLLVHTAGGLALLAGIVLHYHATGGDLSFNALDISQPTVATWLILIGFMLNAAVFPLHSWLPDAYGEASVVGAVFMCAFTTKTAVYTLARGFAGMEILIPLGVIMAVVGVIYAVLENDARRLLAYSIISQVGYMVAAVGIGSSLAINGAAAHAFAHILYKGLLFMGVGSVLHMTGTSKFTELGGLYKKMPRTLLFTLVGCASIAAFPLFSGFVSKSMIISAGFYGEHYWATFILLAASAGTFLYNGLKLPYLIWFGESRCSQETYERAADPPWHMQLAMGMGAFFCVLVGVYYPYLYGMLPNPVEYQPYNAYQLAETLQLLGFTALAFYVMRKMLLPIPTITLDLDWLYRKGGLIVLWLARKPIQGADTAVNNAYNTWGLNPLMTVSRFWSWFDWHAIDGVVDGLARTVRGVGDRVRHLQAARIQVNVFTTVAFVAVLLILYVFAN
ncbi:Na(+)/H(+) antiporter subunit D [Desulfurivibrio alkaliphilus]|uniref:NADH/Ubiquinone/plastoquinone (Complex I) n=1 Tax=Desulfurivibrio alkaliphilus (strain DSM 19089 / UNIQEM U267 / AHT2) TaxID=589865 RepID=D6Z4X5_DESAT|nr:Na(+)/H(+) antiporter subunit D [Desulfurivibrio alkaliphilus]ADH86600.1 NADH/Ubiquinone/plastoquinone (complex I) [Desulfurivibrio alkaliphilus AHT 2]